MIVYHIPPIDIWEGWQEPKDAEWLDDAEWGPMWAKAQELARKVGWEGDIRTGPYVTVLPFPPGPPPVVIGWKQSNNGNCFIASPYEMPWLKTEFFERIEE